MTRIAVLFLVVSSSLSGGCAALTNPVADGVPVRRLPNDVLARPKADLRPVPLTMLRQKEPDQYRLDRGDVLAVIAEEVIAPGNIQPPVRLPDAENSTAAVGYPLPVNDDGTITLPRLKPISVRGKTLPEVDQLIRDAITGKTPGYPELIKPGAERVSVQLLQKRRYHVLVVREDSVPVAIGTSGILGGTKRGAGFNLHLPAYENDVLRALNATGGLPGLDAKNEVVIIRGGIDSTNPNATWQPPPGKNAYGNAERIPLRIFPDQTLSIKPEDIVLKDGDVVLIETRETEVYYTAGLTGSNQFPLPRDYDMDVIQALAQAHGPLLNGGFSQNMFVAQATNSGVGAPSPSLCVVLRQLPNQTQLPIRVDLNRAFQDPRERILIQPGDIIVLQETPGEAFARYVTQTMRLTTTAAISRNGDATTTFSGTNP